MSAAGRLDYWLEADWPAPTGIRAGVTLRRGGLSRIPFDSLNLAAHVGDDCLAVARNRQQLCDDLQLPGTPIWLNQQHTNHVVIVDIDNQILSEPADAVYTSLAHCVCAVMTADCLPVLFCDRQGEQIAAVHAGWRGLLDGVLENTLALFGDTPILAWLGPAISQQAFEVGDELRAAFVDHSADDGKAFIQGVAGKWHADLYQLARHRLQPFNVDIYGAQACTFTQRERYFSYRRDGQTGRMASLIWREKN